MQVTIWAAFFALVVPGAMLLSHVSGGAHAAGVVQTAHSTSTAPGPGQPLASGAHTGPGSSGPALTKFGYGPKNAMTLLPAFRWRGAAGQLFSKTGTFKVATSLLSAISGVVLEIAALVWWVLLEIMKFALSDSWLRDAAFPINRGFYQLSRALGGSGLFWVMAVCFAAGAMMVILRGRIHQVVTMFLAFAIPLAFVAALAGTIDPSQTKAHYGIGPKGSPSWIALTGTGFVHQAVTDLTKGVDLATFGTATPKVTKIVSAGAGTLSNLDVNKAPNCQLYDEVLYNQYDAYAAETKNLGNYESLGTLSRLWQAGFMNYWQQAQFGTGPYASLPACHLLDANSGQPSAELVAISKLAYPTLPTAPSAETAALEYSTNGVKSFEAELFGYAACYYTGGAWKLRPGWAQLDRTSTAGSAASPTDCQGWWRTSNGTSQTHGDFYWTTATNLRAGLSGAGSTPSAQVKVQNAYNLVYNAWGDEAATRLFNAILAAVVSVVYFWALGPMALGAALAQLGLVLMLILLPATLYLVAWPSIRQGDKTRVSGIGEVGRRMLRMTVGFLAAQFAMLVAAALLIAIIGIMETLLGNFQDLNALGQMIGPLLALFFLRYLLKKAKIGNITSLSGALAMPAAAGMAIAGESAARDTMRQTGDAIGRKTGISRFDRFAKRTNPVALGARGTKWAAKTGAGLLMDKELGRELLAARNEGGMAAVKKKAAVAAAIAAGGPAAGALVEGWQKTTSLKAGLAGYKERLKNIEGASRLAFGTSQGKWALGVLDKAAGPLNTLSALGMPVQGLANRVDKTLHPTEVPALQADAKRSLSPGELAMRSHMLEVHRVSPAPPDRVPTVNVHLPTAQLPTINLPTVPLNRPTVQHRITIPSVVVKAASATVTRARPGHGLPPSRTPKGGGAPAVGGRTGPRG